MIRSKWNLLVVVILLLRYADCLRYACPESSITLGQCHDGTKERVKTYYVFDHGHCRNKTHTSYVHCKESKLKDFCKCSAIGDPHYKTYDGQTIHYFGDCQYQLTKFAGRNDTCSFEVRVQNEAKGLRSNLTCTKTVFIHIFGEVFEIGHHHGLKVNGVQKSIPFEKGIAVRIFISGKVVQFVAPQCGVNVAFDGECNLFVEVSRRYAGKMTGICGDCNGQKDDFRTKLGRDVSNKHDRYNLIGDSYAVPSGSRPCSPARSFDVDNVCKGEWKRRISQYEHCGSLIAKRGPFFQCGSSGKLSMKDFFVDCQIDVCSNLNNENHRAKARCKILEGVAESCAEAGFPGIRWRSTLNCPMKCHANQHFSSKANPCPRTCENHFYGSKDPCYHLPEREACECNDGYIRDGSLCVRPAQCKCVDICVDRMGSKKCVAWKKQGRCLKFPAQMNKICTKTCGFCKSKASDCEDQLNTWRCLQFRDEGKCVKEFYREVCGLTCNYERCACAKDREVVAPCDILERKQTISYYHYVRNRHGRCIKRVTQRTRVCNCPFVYRIHRGPCNFCTGRTKVTIFIQKEVNGSCARRHKVAFIRCSNCPANPRATLSCLHNHILVKTISFHRRIGCFKCSLAQKTIKHSIKCKSTVIEAKCNMLTCIKTITHTKRRPSHCKCVEHRYQKNVKCCCRKKDKNLKPFCRNGIIVHRRVIYQFANGVCRPIFRDRIEIPKCRTPKNIHGRCHRHRQGRLHCIAEDIHYSTNLDSLCHCVIKHHKHFRTCCCKKAESYTICDKNVGILETIRISYTLVRKHRRFHCKKNKTITVKAIHFPTQYVRREGKCQANCIKTDIIIKKFRDGCEIKEVFERTETAICCCHPAQITKRSCLGDIYIAINVYNRIVVNGQCIDVLLSSSRQIIDCLRQTITRSECIYPGNRRLVTITTYNPVKCACVKRQRFHYEQCFPCSYKEYKTITRLCNHNTCLQDVITYFQDTDCRYKVKKCSQLCCCKDKPWKSTFCDRNTGVSTTINYWYYFDTVKRTCSERSSKISSSFVCPLFIIITNGKCGEHKKHYIKRSLERSLMDKNTCRCKPSIEVQYIICSCKPTNYSEWRCVNGNLVRDVISYAPNYMDNSCSSKRYQEFKQVVCPRPRPNKTVKIHRCKFAIYRYFYQIVDCKCKLKRKSETFITCCRRPPRVVRKCVKENTVETTTIVYRVRSDRKKCIAQESVSRRIIACKRYISRTQTSCIRGIYFIITVYHGVRKCSCVRLRVHKERRICECIPNIPVVKTVCRRNKWITTVTKLKLQDGRCIPVSIHTESIVGCVPKVSTHGPCNRATGFISVRTVYHIIFNCKCVTKVRYHNIKCRCWRRDRIVRKGCIKHKRIVQLERYEEVNGKCQWIVTRTEFEDCECPKRVSITKCHKDHLFRTITTYYVFVYVHLKIYVKRCCKRSKESFSSVICNKDYRYTTPCKNFTQSIVAYIYDKIKCKCRERCRQVCVKACQCEQKNYCKEKCFRNVKYRICHKFSEHREGCSDKGSRCQESVSQQLVPFNCSPPFIPFICTACTIYKNNGFYKKCTRFFAVKELCQCRISQVVTTELCRCRDRCVSKPLCRRNHHVTITTYFVIKHGRCVPRTTKFVRRIVCPRPFVTMRNLRCATEYTLTYYTKRHCQCIKRQRTRINKLCCRKTSVVKFCKQRHWEYIQKTYVQRVTNIKLFPLFPGSPLQIFCQCITRRWIRCKHCPENYVITYCNTATLRQRIDIYEFHSINCVCERRVRTMYEDCHKCPKKSVHRSGCHPLDQNGIGYVDVTITYYKIMTNNHCKKLVRHRKKPCKCWKPYENHFCRNGETVTETVTFPLHSHPPCTKHVLKRSKSIFCYNHGKPNPWILVRIVRTTEPGEYTVWYYERWVFDAKTCACTKEYKKENKEIICRPCVKSVKCVNNAKVHTTICQRSQGLKCVPYAISSSVEITCPRPIKIRVGPCIKGFQRYRWTIFRRVRCHCIKRSSARTERCQCFPKEIRICDGTRWKIITTVYILVNGQCIPKSVVSYKNIHCPQIGFFKDYPIDKCSFWRYYYVKVVKNCVCVDKLIKKVILHNCCKKERRAVTCEKDRFVVTTRFYFILIQFHCHPRVSSTKRHIDCSKLVLEEEIKTGLCRVKYIYYKIAYRGCTCQRKRIREVAANTCCSHLEPYSKKTCNKMKGLIITLYYTFFLGLNGHCHVAVKIISMKVHCNRKECHTVIGDCVNNTRLVKLYCKRRIHCRCVMKLVHQGYQCCKQKDFQWKVVGPCIKCFRKITYYAYRFDKRTNLCKVVAIREQRQRCSCRCLRRYSIKSCVKDVYRKVVTVTYKLNSEKDTCVVVKDEHVTAINGCKKEEQQLGIESQTCDEITGRGTVTHAYVHAENCECKKTRRVKPIICCCKTAFPTTKRIYCKKGNIIVVETTRAECKGDVVTYITSYKETPILNCDKIVEERGVCFNQKDGNAIRIKYVLKVQYMVTKCKCHHKVIEKKKRHCRCRPSWSQEQCHVNRVIIVTHSYYISHGICQESVSSVIRRIPCPSHPKVTKTQCKNNHYQIITQKYYYQNCKCISRISVKTCDCSCPRRTEYRRCTRRYNIEVIKTLYRKVNCKCAKYIHTRIEVPKCPPFNKETIGVCIRHRHQGFRTIVLRRAIKQSFICRCIISERKRSEICWCSEVLKHRKFCRRNTILVRETWRRVINKERNKCELVLIHSGTITIHPLRTVRTHNCNKRTGKETETTIYYSVKDCRVVKHVKIDIYDCRCTKKWKLIRRGKCSGPKRCLRTDIYVRWELRYRKCVKINESKEVKCCCYPSQKISKFCKNNRNYTSTITFTLVNGHCESRETLTFTITPCPKMVVVKETKCHHGIKIIRRYIYVLHDCKCVLQLIEQLRCRCSCRRSTVRYVCNRFKQILRKVVTSYYLAGCRCMAKRFVTEVCIRCPGATRSVSPCSPVKGTNYYIETEVITNHHLDRHCKCIPKSTIQTKICKCLRLERTKKWCQKRHHIIKERVTFTILIHGRCVTKVQFKSYPVRCRSCGWFLAGDSGCIPNNKYGLRILTYSRRIAVGCQCKYESKVIRSHCRCTGLSSKSSCLGHKIKIEHYSYHMEYYQCKRTKRITWKNIRCKYLEPIKESCREVSKDLFMEYTVYRERFVLNCQCKTKYRRVGRICRCPKAFVTKKCNRISNQYVFTRVWYELRSTGCKRRVETITKNIHCDLTPDCHVIGKCRKGSRTQSYKCRQRYLDNCRCHLRVLHHVKPCECKPKNIVRGPCNKRTCYRYIVITTFHLIVLRHNQIKCVPSKKERRERCCCRRKPVVVVQCIKDRLLESKTSYYFNTFTKRCDKTRSTIDKSPRCIPRKEIHRGRCNRRTCIRRISITTRSTNHCHCIVHKKSETEECCCKEKDYSVRACIRGNIFKTTTYIHRFTNGHCKKSSTEVYARVKCPPTTVRYLSCRKSTLTQIKETTFYQLRSCVCIKRVAIIDVCCGCPGPSTVMRCIEQTGIQQTIDTWYIFNSVTHSCSKFSKISNIQTYCGARPITSCKSCVVTHNGGIYKVCTTKYEVRIGCRCVHRSERQFILCYCPRPHRYVVCERNVKVTKEVYYVRERSNDNRYDFVCIKKIRSVGQMVVLCPARTVSKGECIGAVIVYTEKYYEVDNCACIMKINLHRVVCSCDLPQQIKKQCFDDVRIETTVLSYTLICDKKEIPNCQCVPMSQVRIKNIVCKKPHFKIEDCKGDLKKITSVHYEPKMCKCVKVEYTTTIGCTENCYDMPHCDKIKKLGLCSEPIYYQFECQETCGYCKKCPKDHVIKHIGKCKCHKVDGYRICSRKTSVAHYIAIGHHCIRRTHVYRTMCNCFNKYTLRECLSLKRQGKCKDRNVMRNCELSCNPNCNIPCHGDIHSKKCVQTGVHRGSYRLVIISFKRLGDICLFTIKKMYQGVCKPCSRAQRTEVTDCVGNVRYVVTYYVQIVHGVCVNVVKRTAYSCKDCCPSKETKVGECHQGHRSVLTIFWANINHCCKKQTLTNVYKCDPRCSTVSRVITRCLLNKRLEFKVWQSGANCESHSVYDVVSCVPVLT